MRIFVKFRDGKVVSQNVPINWSHTTVLKMDKGCGLTVKVSGGAEAPFTIVFNNFGPGEAPIRIDNLCELVHIKVHQPNTVQVISDFILLNRLKNILIISECSCPQPLSINFVYLGRSLQRKNFAVERQLCEIQRHITRHLERRFRCPESTSLKRAATVDASRRCTNIFLLINVIKNHSRITTPIKTIV